MSELTKEAAEARDLAVRRTLELLRGDEVLNTPMRTGAVSETIEERAAALRDAMDQICIKSGLIPPDDQYEDAGTRLEALTATVWEETPENLCLRALAMDALSTCRRVLGDEPGCVAALREAAKLAAAAGPELEAELCHMLLNLSHILAEKGAKEESIPVAKEAARVAAGMKSENLSYGRYALRELSEILSKIGVLDESLNMAMKAVEFAERIDKASHFDRIPLLPESLLQLAEVHHLRGELDAAEAALLRAKAIWEALPPTWLKVDVGIYLHKLACIREEKGDTAGSIALHRETVAFWRNMVAELRSDSPMLKHKLALSLGNLGVALAKQGLCREACPLLEEALVRYDSLHRDDAMGAMWDSDAQNFAAKLDECRAALWEEKNS